MSLQWKQQSERGSSLLMYLITNISLILGRNIGRLLLYPITIYFVVISRKSRIGSRLYLQRVFSRPVGFTQVFKHYHTFASTILDRVYFLSNRVDNFNIQIINTDFLDNNIEQGKGCILMGSHLGSFEVLRYLATLKEDVNIKILMYIDNAEKINRVLHALNPNISNLIIPLGHPDSLIAAKDTTDAGGIVAILADRVFSDEKFVECEFFGDSCRFPSGPIILASILEVPVMLFYGLYEKDLHYRVQFEMLTDGLKFTRENRDELVAYWMQKYANRLEAYSKQYPYNWFNFYDYWNEKSSS
ncbi:MAG: lipid A biosynthesis acyltransferase [Candidatus Thiodiazotropha sp. (ex Lucinoma borealis)]|nr:lipid A biosynthesis acyltransferase [Candidatus Thiodiazotropha sp. (ex Lucinoma borealis)]MCU7867403.1 lipid A biosynthesis acyltransferase [Candidatus Thiodiazotropha sp. (ex Lucinoma borealis)]